MCVEIESQLVLRHAWELDSLRQGKYSVTGLKWAKEKQSLSHPA